MLGAIWTYVLLSQISTNLHLLKMKVVISLWDHLFFITLIRRGKYVGKDSSLAISKFELNIWLHFKPLNRDYNKLLSK